MPVDPKRTAVVLIEYQNDFTSDGGALHGAVQEVMERTGMLENTRRLDNKRCKRCNASRSGSGSFMSRRACARATHGT